MIFEVRGFPFQWLRFLEVNNLQRLFMKQLGGMKIDGAFYVIFIFLFLFLPVPTSSFFLLNVVVYTEKFSVHGKTRGHSLVLYTDHLCLQLHNACVVRV